MFQDGIQERGIYMSDGYVFSDINSFYPQKNIANNVKQRKSNDLRTKILKILVGLLSFVLLLEAGWYMIVMPCTSSVELRFSGLTQYAPEDIIKSCGLNVSQTWINFDTGAISSRLSKSPLFESVQVEKVFPSQVIITVKERKTAAIALTEINGESVAVQVDNTGYVYRIDGSVPSGNIPIISGLTFENLHAGIRLNSKLRPLLKQIGTILETKPAYFSAISEIRIVPKDYDEYDLILYPMHSKIRVLADKELNEESLQYMMVVLDVIDSLESDVTEVDLRYGAVSYKMSNSQRSHQLSGVSLSQDVSSRFKGAEF